MKKAPLLRLILPAIVGALLVRSWLSSRPRDAFYGTGEICSLVFSSDGKTLLVTQRNFPNSFAAKELTALHFDRSFTPKWSYHDGEELGTPQFFLSDSRILVDRGFIRTLDANTGQELRKEGDLRRAAISSDGKWLAYRGAYPSDMGCIAPPTISQTNIVFQSFAKPTHSKTLLQRKGGRPTFLFSPDGQSFVTGGFSRHGTQLELYNAKTQNLIHTWPDFEAYWDPRSIHWSRNGRFLISVYCISVGKGPQAIIHLWRVRDGQLISSLTVPGTEETTGRGLPMAYTIPIYPSFEVQNDGRVLQFGTDDSVSLSKSTDLGAGFEPLLSLPSQRITSATLSPDGSYLVAGTKSGKVVWKRVK